MGYTIPNSNTASGRKGEVALYYVHRLTRAEISESEYKQLNAWRRLFYRKRARTMPTIQSTFIYPDGQVSHDKLDVGVLHRPYGNYNSNKPRIASDEHIVSSKVNDRRREEEERRRREQDDEDDRRRRNSDSYNSALFDSSPSFDWGNSNDSGSSSSSSDDSYSGGGGDFGGGGAGDDY